MFIDKPNNYKKKKKRKTRSENLIIFNSTKIGNAWASK